MRHVFRLEREWNAQVERDHIDGGWIAWCLEVPGCMSQGETEAEALRNLTDAADECASSICHVPRVHLAAVIYMVAARAGEPPTVAVSQHFNVSKATASRIVAGAREQGLLPPASPGSSPRVNRKVIAIAAELGVQPDELRDAVLKHAGGNLRIR